MCDYSLEHVASRPAEVGDKLITTVFPNSITRGFSAVGSPETAVCLRPGTELSFEQDVEYGRLFGIRKKLKEKTAIFGKVNPDIPHTHHDALEFPSGKVIALATVVEGQTATVLQLPAQPAVKKVDVEVKQDVMEPAE